MHPVIEALLLLLIPLTASLTLGTVAYYVAVAFVRARKRRRDRPQPQSPPPAPTRAATVEALDTPGAVSRHLQRAAR